MSRDELRQYRAVCAEIDQLEWGINQEYRHGVMIDNVIGSTPEFPYTLGSVTIVGPSEEAYERMRLMAERMSQKMDERIALREELEEYFDTLDVETAVILRGKYIDGNTWREVAQKLGKSEDGVRMRINRLM